MADTFRALCAELLNGLVEQQHPDYPWPGYTLAAMDRARALLAEPEPEGPTDQEIEEWADACSEAPLEEMDPEVHGWRRCFTAKEFSETIRAALDRWGRPAAAPVPVSERLPGPEDCDAEGRCWLGGRLLGTGTPTWLLGYPDWVERFPNVHHFWLPAHALPLPAPEGGEVQQ